MNESQTLVRVRTWISSNEPEDGLFHISETSYFALQAYVESGALGREIRQQIQEIDGCQSYHDDDERRYRVRLVALWVQKYGTWVDPTATWELNRF